jgi:Cellulose binding domain
MGSRRPNASGCLVVLAAAISAAACANGDTTGDSAGDDAGPYTNSGSGSIAASGSDNGNSGSVGASTPSAGGASGAVESSGSVIGEAGSGTDSDDAGSGTDSSVGASAVGSSINDGDAESGAVPGTGLSVLYQVAAANSSSPYLGCELSIVNAGTGSPAISTLKARYYFTDEVHLAEQMTINWSHVATSGANADVTVTSSFAPVVPAAMDADTYIEFGFSGGHSLLGPGESVMFAWQMQGPDPAKDVYTQSNDYSFDGSKKTLTAWSHIVLLQSGAIVWGTPPSIP